MKASFVKSLLL